MAASSGRSADELRRRRRMQEFYHGTTNDIEGGVIRPGKDIGYSNWAGVGRWANQAAEEHAFVTTDEDVAWDYANQANAKQTGDYAAGLRDKPPGRTRVYSTHQNPEMKPGHYRGLREYVAPSFEVKDQIDIMPGRQGTFPTINWRQFQAYPPPIGPDANHPTNEEVASGMDPWRPGKGRSLVKSNRNQVSAGQLDLFTGRTAAEHADAYDPYGPDERALSVYHQLRMSPHEHGDLEAQARDARSPRPPKK